MKYILGLLLATTYLLNKVEAVPQAAVVYPKCMECKVVATGKDGTLWGWENDNYCRIRRKRCGYATPAVTVIRKTTKVATSKKVITSKKVKTSSDVPTANKATKVNTTTTTTAVTFETDAKGNKVCNGCVVTATGGGGSDLWGWEAETSCIIDQKKCEGKIEQEVKKNNVNAEANHKKDAKGNLICNGCNVTATGSEGVSLWGWEDEASCIIDNVKCNIASPKPEQPTTPLLRGQDGILICSTCEYTTLREDTTLWNKENGEDCRVIGSRCNINTTPHPWCTGCVVTGTGADGALYGWEMQASCLINEISCGLYVPGENNPSDPRFAKSNDSLKETKEKSLIYITATLIILLITQFI